MSWSVGRCCVYYALRTNLTHFRASLPHHSTPPTHQPAHMTSRTPADAGLQRVPLSHSKLERKRNDKRLARRANCCNGCATCQAPATVLVGCCASATAAIFAECFESARRRRFASTASRKSTNSAKALSVSAKSCRLVCVQSVAQN